MAVDSGPNVFTYNGSSWSGANDIDPNQGLSSVSCRSSSFCVAVDGAGNALTYNGSSWSSASIDPNGQGLVAVSCASSSFCMALDSVGDALKYGPEIGTPPPARACIVPKLKGDTLKKAKSALRKADCKLGKVTKRAAKVRKGRVISSKPKARTKHKAGTKVALTISKGKAHRRR